MNDQNTKNGAGGKLEQLTEEQQAWIADLATKGSLMDLAEALKEHGIDTSAPSLSRFLKRHRERQLVKEGEESAAVVTALAERGMAGKLREGTLQAVRQRLYDRAVLCTDAAEAKELYATLVMEEVKLKEMELEARKVAALEQQVKLQGLRIQVLAEQGAASGRGRIKAKVGSSESVVEVHAVGAGTENGGGSRDELLALLREVNEIAGRGGSCEEWVLEIRGRLALGVKLLEAGGS
jgi:hypothetical protein